MKYPSSREYKMMLKPAVFAGSPAERGEAVAAFWQRLEAHLAGHGMAAAKRLALGATRQVAFLDTPDQLLYEKFDLIVRLRQAQTDSPRSDVTLKFRHGDRLQAATKRFRPRKPFAADGPAVTFEEDIKAVPSPRGLGFWALFSRSARAEIEEATILSDIRGLGRVYAKLPAPLAGLAHRPLVLVGGLVIVEELYKGGRFTVGDTRAEVAVILWFDKEDPRAPMAAELSFRFDLHKGAVAPTLAAEAWDLFRCLHALDDVDARGSTKTALVYGAGQQP